MNNPSIVSTLSNGTVLLTEKVTSVKSVCIGFWFRVGVKNETILNNGISHFIEHMLFKGTNSRTAIEIAESFDSIGGQINAFSSKEYCCFYARVINENIEFAIECLVDMIRNSLFDDEEFHKERSVIIEEIKRSKDSPDDLSHEYFHSQVIKDSILGQPILGSEKVLDSLTPEVMKEYFYENYTSESLLISLVGNFELENVVRSVERELEGFKPGAQQEKPDKAKFHQSCTHLIKSGLEQAQIVFGLPGISASSSKRYDFNLLCTSLGGGMSSKLYQTIREKEGLAYTIYNYSMAFSTFGLYVIYVGTSPEWIEKNFDLIFRELEVVRKNGLSEQEIDKSKAQIRGSLVLGLESTSSRMNRMALNWIHHNRIITVEESLKEVIDVTRQNICDLAEEILQFELGSATILSDEKGLEKFSRSPLGCEMKVVYENSL